VDPDPVGSASFCRIQLSKQMRFSNMIKTWGRKDPHGDRHRFKADPDPDWKQNENSDPDPDRHKNGADPQRYMTSEKKRLK
jgi:hypothetical protein